MPGLHCIAIGCTNGHYRLAKWKQGLCALYKVNNGAAEFIIDPPFRRDSLHSSRGVYRGGMWTQLASNMARGKEFHRRGGREREGGGEGGILRREEFCVIRVGG
jgi:hypothetical protein